jgi:hypothetical protein
MPEAYQSEGATNDAKSKPRASGDRKTAWWWRYPDEEKAGCVNTLVQQLLRQQEWRFRSYQRYLRMYNNMLAMVWAPRGMDLASAPQGQKLSLNVVKSVSDTFTAKMTLEQPKCTFLTSGGSWSLQQKAKDLEKFIDGQLYEMGTYDSAPSWVLDACAYGNGYYKILVDGDLRTEESAMNARVAGERTRIWELLVDNNEAVQSNGRPKNFFQRKYVDRLILSEQFPKKAAEIMDEESNDPRDNAAVWENTISDRVPVHMAWHLPSFKGAKDGWYFIGTPQVMLQCVPWPHDYAPFAVYRRMPPLEGWYGIGIAEEIRGIQQDINNMIQRIQKHIQLMAVPKWWAATNSGITSGMLDNDVEIVRSAVKPEVLMPPGVFPPDAWQFFERQYQRAFEIPGVNQMQAMAQKPAGLDSGKAQDTYIDIVSERFSVASRNYHQMFLEIGRQVIDRARDITRMNKKYAVMSVSRNASQSIEFLETDLTAEEAVLQMYPTHKLSRDPAEKMAQVERLVNTGMVDPKDAPRLLGFPDLEQEWNLKYASYDLSMQIIERILDGGETIHPRPYMDLGEALKWATLKLMYAERMGCPEPRLQALREWIQEVEELEAKAHPPQPLPGAGAPPGLPSGPMPPPAALPQGAPPQAAA